MNKNGFCVTCGFFFLGEHDCLHTAYILQRTHVKALTFRSNCKTNFIWLCRVEIYQFLNFVSNQPSAKESITLNP